MSYLLTAGSAPRCHSLADDPRIKNRRGGSKLWTDENQSWPLFESRAHRWHGGVAEPVWDAGLGVAGSGATGRPGLRRRVEKYMSLPKVLRESRVIAVSQWIE